ncbi:MAG: anti-sigma factor antagonist [Verrucomicrobia bacterium]|nr:anti-sigma factor antagonist [Verrucomicrobiota bacterium]
MPTASGKVRLCSWEPTRLPLGFGFMEIKEKNEKDVVVLAIQGEIDLHVSPTLRTALKAKAQAKTPRLLLNFAEVAYIDSSGLATLIEYYQSARTYQGKFGLCCLNLSVRSSIELVRLTEVFSIFPTEAEALKSLASS